MPVEISIHDDDIKYLNRPAKAELQKVIENYYNDLLKEANRLEATSKATQGSPEITSTLIKDADLLFRRGYRKPKRSPWLKAAQIGSTVASVITGILADPETLKSTLLIILFIVVFSIAIATTVLVVAKE